jgi:hypothetical protein
MNMVTARTRAATVRCSAIAATLCFVVTPQRVHAEEIKVLHPQGSAHGFVEVVDVQGKRLATGDLLQRAHGSTVSSELVLHFLDGSLDDETTVFSQRGVFRFISDHHVQRGPSFPTATDVTIDAPHELVTALDADGGKKETHFAMPADLYNGMATTLLMNLPPNPGPTTIAVILGAAHPRLAHLDIKRAGKVAFLLGGVSREGTDFDVHIDLGGVVSVVAPVIGKQPDDYHVLIVDGPDPAFIRMQGQLFEGAPVWQIRQISATFP